MAASTQNPLTESLVAKVLSTDKGEDVKCISWFCQDFMEAGTSYTTALTCLKVKFCIRDKEENKLMDEQVVSYIVKYDPSRGGPWTDFMRMTFDKEIRFFTELGPALSSRLNIFDGKGLMLPKCILTSQIYPEIIIQEDLRDFGYKMHDRKVGMDNSHTVLALTELARFHASSVVLRENGENLSGKYEFLTYHWSSYKEEAEEGFKSVIGGHLENAQFVLERVPGYEKAAEWVRGLKSTLVDTYKNLLASDQKFSVACHFDLVNNNFLFRYCDDGNPVDVIILDFQMCYLSSVATDLSEFMFTCPDDSQRRSNFQRYLEAYYTTLSHVVLSNELQMPFSLEELQVEYKSKLVFGAIAAMSKIPFMIAETDEMPDMEGFHDVDNFMHSQQRNLLIMLHKYPNFKSRFLSVFDDLLAYGIF